VFVCLCSLSALLIFCSWRSLRRGGQRGAGTGEWDGFSGTYTLPVRTAVIISSVAVIGGCSCFIQCTLSLRW